jgi:hypothetical protein
LIEDFRRRLAHVWLGDLVLLGPDRLSDGLNRREIVAETLAAKAQF